MVSRENATFRREDVGRVWRGSPVWRENGQCPSHQSGVPEQRDTTLQIDCQRIFCPGRDFIHPPSLFLAIRQFFWEGGGVHISEYFLGRNFSSLLDGAGSNTRRRHGEEAFQPCVLVPTVDLRLLLTHAFKKCFVYLVIMQSPVIPGR